MMTMDFNSERVRVFVSGKLFNKYWVKFAIKYMFMLLHRGWHCFQGTKNRIKVVL